MGMIQNYFLKWYIEGKSYQDCIYPEKKWIRDWLLECKRNGWGLSKEEAIEKADEILENIDLMADNYRAIHGNKNDKELDNFLNDILYRLISRALKEELDG